MYTFVSYFKKIKTLLPPPSFSAPAAFHNPKNYIKVNSYNEI